nr:adenine-specific methyltransferase EcoRI family protein [Acutalibacter muris]
MNVDKTADIPCDYSGIMGVPITILDKWCSDQFELLGIANSARWLGYECYTIINGKKIYNRVLIRNKNPKRLGEE